LKQLSSLLKIPVSALLLSFTVAAHGGDPYRPSAGAGQAGMGYVCIMQNRFWSSFHNQASLAFNNTSSFGINYENRFIIKDLGTSVAGLIIPAGKSSLGIVYSHFGNKDFKRDMTGLACGMRINEKISAGVQVDCFSERTSDEYANFLSVTCEAGVILKPSENVRIGLHVFNPVPNSLRKTTLPTRLRVGAGVDLNKLLFAGIEAEMSTCSKLNIKTGFEYEAAKKIWMRGGYSTLNNSFSFGLGYLVEIAQIDVGFVTHESLGMSSSVSLIFKIH
jgi:hypothetical protein